jgi:hypothetical protein
MLPKDKEFDLIFRDRLRDHSSPVNPDVWRQVRNRIGRRRRRILGWFFLGAIPAAFLFVFLAEPQIFVTRHTPVAPALTSSAVPSSVPASSTAALSAAAPSAHSTRTAPSPAFPQFATTKAVVQLSSRSGRKSSQNHATIPGRQPAVPRPTILQTADFQSVVATSAAADFARPHTPHLTLPALVRLSTRDVVTAYPPGHPSQLNCPKMDPGSDFFDHFYLSLFGGTGIPTYHLGLTYIGGVRLTIQVTRHWSATTGLLYSQTSYKHIVFDSITGGFRKIDLPILIGYSFLGDQSSITVNGGVLLNFRTENWHGFGPKMPMRTGPSGYIGVAYLRSLDERWSVFAEPYLQYSFSNNHLELPLHTWSTGLQLGLRYHL